MDLNVSYPETIKTGNDVIAKSDEFTDLLNKIKQINEDLKSAWEGEDSKKYADVVSEKQVYMDELASDMHSMGEFLVKAGEAYRQTSEDNANAIR